jgi:hypothetical protein
MIQTPKTRRSAVPVRTAPFVAVFTTKGGVGKTEIVRNIAHYAIAERKQMILFDADSQNDSANLLLPKGHSFDESVHKDFERSDYVLVTKSFRDTQVYLERIVVADCPPQMDTLEILGKAVSFWIIPVGSDDREVQQAISLANILKLQKRRFAFVLSRWNMESEYSRDYVSALFAVGPIFGVILHFDADSVDISRVQRVPVIDNDDDLGESYQLLAKWVLMDSCRTTDDWMMTEEELETLFDVEDFEAIRAKERVRYA